MDKPVVCFGEVLLRLSAPGRELLLQSPRLDVSVAGAEANVAVSLACLGGRARVVSILPDNPLGRAARDELRRHGVDVSAIAWRPGRVGLYYLSQGAVLRPAEITYDREGSSFADAPHDLIDWPPILRGAGRLHLSGVTPAVSPQAAEAALRAAAAANAAGVPVSFDGNYRAKMWARWAGDGAGVLRRLLANCDIAFADDRDVALVLGQSFAGSWTERVEQAAAAAFEQFPGLQFLACTDRRQTAADRHELGAACIRRGGALRNSRRYQLDSVVDRIGAGDAFAAGVLHTLGNGGRDDDALAFGLAASVLKHSVPGDFNLVGEAEVRRLLSGGGLGVQR